MVHHTENKWVTYIVPRIHELAILGSDGLQWCMPMLVTILRDGGLPPLKKKKWVNRDWVKQALPPKLCLILTEVARILRIYRNTLRYKLRKLGLHRSSSQLTDLDLNQVLRHYKCIWPDSGLQYTTGFLQHHGIRLQRWHICNSLECIDGLGCALRYHDSIQHRHYQSTQSDAIYMYMYHIDGNHKLISWGFVIHGIIDGHDHMVCFSI